jgi:pimeloyl-ACP methyl ester carboxylesterase
MFPNFLPASIQQLTEPMSIAMGQSIGRIPIPTPLCDRPIETAHVRRIPGENTESIISANTETISLLNPASPIVLLHGFDSSLFEFRRLLPQLGQDYPTWAIDLLGFGFTDRGTGIAAGIEFTPATIKTHLYATWQQLIQRPMVLVGASMGGAAAIDFALTYPEAVERLVLIDGAGFAKGPAVSRVVQWIPPIGRWATNFLRRPDVRRKVSQNAYFDDARFVTADAECCAALHLEMPHWSEALISFTASGGYNFLSDRISQISQPTLVIWGREDKILGTKDATRFTQTIADVKLVWIEQCGHVPHLEQPEATAQAIKDFLQTERRERDSNPR